jgi:hypothetical protein
VQIASSLKNTLCVISLLSLAVSNARNTGDGFTHYRGAYLGQRLPGYKPEPFAQELFSVWSDYGFHLNTCVRFSPDNNELLFTDRTLPAVAGKSCSIWRMTQQNGVWAEPQIASFSSDYSDNGTFYSSTGDTLYFFSTRPASAKGPPKDIDTWYVRRSEDGWSRPQRLGYPVNTAYDDFGGVVTTDGTMYLSSDRPRGRGGADIYYTRFIHGNYGQLVNLGESVNTDADEYVVYVADDESFMIIHRSDMHDDAENGLYVSYKEAGQGWTRAKSMGDHINALNAIDASVSPDGDYLFLLSRGDGIYWLKIDIVEYLKNENLEVSKLLISAVSEGDLDAALLTHENLEKRHSVYMEIDEYLLNQRGYQLLDARQYVEALVLFQIVVELFPGSWNAYDSLGEAYVVSGQANSAIRCYEKSLELNPRNENAAKMLKYIHTLLGY